MKKYINQEINDLVVNESRSIKFSLKKIQKNGFGSVFIIDNKKKLLGIMTDGDIRKAIIKGGMLGDAIRNYYNNKVKYLPYNSNNQTIQNLLSNKIKIIPLVNEKKIIVDFATADRIKKIPIFIKLPRIDEINYYEELIRPIKKFPDVGVVLSNTLPIDDKRLKVGKGGKSGSSLFESTLKILRYVRKSHPEIVIMCSGGISSSEQAKILLNEGANALQIYTSLVYKGPGIIKELNNSLLNN